jgi:hypothetical protein
MRLAELVASDVCFLVCLIKNIYLVTNKRHKASMSIDYLTHDRSHTSFPCFNLYG